MLESGVVSMVSNYGLFINELFSLEAIRRDIADEEESRTVPFVMSDWKILSIFLGWAFFLLMSSFVFLLEIAAPDIKKRHRNLICAFKGLLYISEKSILLFRTLVRSFQIFTTRICGTLKIFRCHKWRWRQHSWKRNQ